MKRLAWLILILVTAVAVTGQAQSSKTNRTKKSHKTSTSQKPAKKRKKGVSLAKPTVRDFQPTCNLDSGSVGYYFFPANLDASWHMRILTQRFDEHSKFLQADTSYSFEHVVSDSNRTLQGLPVIEVQSSAPYHFGNELTAATMPITYYVDDSIVMYVMNHSISSAENRNLLVNPLRVGNHWHDKAEDTTVTEIIALNEPVTVPVGAFANALVVRTRIPNGELSKYFVPGWGIVKTVFRATPPTLAGTLVITTEMIALDRGDTTRSIKNRFWRQQAQKQN